MFEMSNIGLKSFQEINYSCILALAIKIIGS